MKYGKKGQAALEFLTTYGWAFLVILVMIGGLSYFGVFDFSKGLKESCTVDGKFQCSDNFLIQNDISDSVQIELKNDNAQAVTISSFSLIEKGLSESATAVTACSQNLAGSPISLAPGSFTLVAVDFTAAQMATCGITDNVDSKKIFNYEFTYTASGSSIEKTGRGTITATVE